MAPTVDDIAAFVPFAHALAEAARKEILPHFRAADPGLEDKAKSGAAFDPVTLADRNAEAAIRRLIESAFPEHGVIGEEYGVTPARGPWAWVLDPVDGTRAFIAGLPTWGTLIGLTYEGRPVLGVLDQAYLDERYIGHGGGAEAIWRGVRRSLKVRPCPALTDAILATTDAHLFQGAEAGGFEMARRTARLTRYGYDCYAYAMVAAGFIDAVIESGLKQHDVAALIPIIEGAGGVVSDWRGRPCWQGGQVIAAGDRRVRDQALVALSRAAPP